MPQYDSTTNIFTLTATEADFTIPGTPAGGINAGIVGNSLGNSLTGNAGNNRLEGGGGNDRLDGSVGDDVMVGGTGHDVYTVDSVGDQIVEGADEGNDSIESSISLDLRNFVDATGRASVEGLYLRGTQDLDGVGTRFANSLAGNSGNNHLSGLEGEDYLYGLDGNDSLDGGEGNDVLVGGLGSDVMSGGIGDDTYKVDSEGDVIVEAVNEGVDTVHSTISLDLRKFLGPNGTTTVEDLVLDGTASLDGTGTNSENYLTGNAGANRLAGLAGNDILDGWEGNDYLDGGEGSDGMLGGTGDDTYVVDSLGDYVREVANEGLDLVQSSITLDLRNYLEGSVQMSIENLTLTGTGSLNGIGNGLGNLITGNSGTNELQGLDGNDTLDGGGGADRLIGGLGNDVYIIDVAGDEVVEAAGGGTDSVLTGFSYTLTTNVENLTLTGTGNFDGTGNDGANIIDGSDGANVLDGRGGADKLYGNLGDDTFLVDEFDSVYEADGEGNDTVKAGFTLDLKDYLNVENITLTGTGDFGGTGSDADNRIFGTSGKNYLVGLGGNDLLDGGAGNDDLDGGAGNDTFAGGAGADRLDGGAGDDLLDGGAGDDRMSGGAGSDRYVVDSAGDVVTDDGTAGDDTVIAKISYTIGATIEKLSLDNAGGNINATGNALDNIIFGNAGNNVVDGGGGRDELYGATGSDTVYGGEGDDTIHESGSDNDMLDGGAGNDRIEGEGGNDHIDGGAGIDTLIGGAGDDFYVVDSGLDMVREDAGGGTDTIMTGTSYTLAAGLSVENLTAMGNAAVALTGNEGANILTGNAFANNLSGMTGNDGLRGEAGHDRLAGGMGLDMLNGGAGRDVFVFDTALARTSAANKATNYDRVTDYVVRDDSIQLDNAIFRKIGKGTINKPGKLASKFFALDAANDKDDHVIYNRKTGVLSYDVDGSGHARAIEFAKLSPKLKMTAAEFFVI